MALSLQCAPRGTLRPVTSQSHTQKSWRLLFVPGLSCSRRATCRQCAGPYCLFAHTGWGQAVGSNRDSHCVGNWRLGPGVSQVFPIRALHGGQVCGVAGLRCQLCRGSSQAPGGGSNNNYSCLAFVEQCFIVLEMLSAAGCGQQLSGPGNLDSDSLS